jgi:hypothetical protein
MLVGKTWLSQASTAEDLAGRPEQVGEGDPEAPQPGSEPRVSKLDEVVTLVAREERAAIEAFDPCLHEVAASIARNRDRCRVGKSQRWVKRV